MSKIIFLDIDGTLNSRQYILQQGDLWDHPSNKYTPDGKFMQSEMDPLAVARLNRITDATGAKIVVISTWRLSYLDDDQGIYRLQDCLLSFGITGEIIGMTPEHVVPHGSILVANGHRGTEVQTWLQEHPEVNSFIILDDETVMGYSDHQLKTEFETGLLDTHVEQVIALLGRK
jgi:hypothetical protein